MEHLINFRGHTAFDETLLNSYRNASQDIASYTIKKDKEKHFRRNLQTTEFNENIILAIEH